MSIELERMTPSRAAYFMERFKREEKLLGPNEQAALTYVIDMLEKATAIQQAGPQQTATAIACGIPGMAKTTCPYCEQGFAFEFKQAEAKTDEPVFFVSPAQARAVNGKNRCHYTPSDNSGRYLPVRATPAGLFTQPVYTHPAPGVPTVSADAFDRVMALLEKQAAQIIELEDSRDAEPGVPDGYALVPVEPTQAMMNVQTWDFSSFYSPREIWSAMLAAKDSK